MSHEPFWEKVRNDLLGAGSVTPGETDDGIDYTARGRTATQDETGIQALIEENGEATFHFWPGAACTARFEGHGQFSANVFLSDDVRRCLVNCGAARGGLRSLEAIVDEVIAGWALEDNHARVYQQGGRYDFFTPVHPYDIAVLVIALKAALPPSAATQPCPPRPPHPSGPRSSGPRSSEP